MRYWLFANYTGTDGIDKIIGVPMSEGDRCIYPDSDVEITKKHISGYNK